MTKRLAAGLTDWIADDETVRKLHPTARQQVAEIREFLDFSRGAEPGIDRLDAGVVVSFRSTSSAAGRWSHRQNNRPVSNRGRIGAGWLWDRVSRTRHGAQSEGGPQNPSPETLLSATARRRFIVEGRAVALLDHPHPLKVFETVKRSDLLHRLRVLFGPDASSMAGRARSGLNAGLCSRNCRRPRRRGRTRPCARHLTPRSQASQRLASTQSRRIPIRGQAGGLWDRESA